MNGLNATVFMFILRELRLKIAVKDLTVCIKSLLHCFFLCQNPLSCRKKISENDGNLPIDLKNQIIYYMGPSPAREGRPVGSAGPTTASRMDKYTPELLDLGLGAMIGKGKRSQAVIDAIKRNKAVYLAAVGGAGALLSKCIVESEVVAYEDLGTEAIRKLKVKDFPAIVVIDTNGNNLYEIAVKEHCRVEETEK